MCPTYAACQSNTAAVMDSSVGCARHKQSKTLLSAPNMSRFARTLSHSRLHLLRESTDQTLLVVCVLDLWCRRVRPQVRHEMMMSKRETMPLTMAVMIAPMPLTIAISTEPIVRQMDSNCKRRSACCEVEAESEQYDLRKRRQHPL